jgi:hypothetical protein
MQQSNKRWYQGQAFKGAMGAVDFGLTYADRRKQHPEESRFVSGGLSALSAGAWLYAPEIMWAKTALDVAKGAGKMAAQMKRDSYERQYATRDNMGIIGGNFQDTELAATTRQRGLQAIQNSRINARSALSNEARSLHRF